MTDNADDTPRFQLSIASVLLIFTGVAVLIAMVRHWDTLLVQMLFALVIMLSVPLSWLVDRINTPASQQSSLSDVAYLKRSGAIFAGCILSMLASYFAMWVYPWSGIPSKTPPSLFIGISLGLSVLAQLPFTDIAPDFANHAYLAVPACGMIFLCVPILRKQECTDLPIRSTVILAIYSVTNICWLIIIAGNDFADLQYGTSASSIINLFLLPLLWGTWLWWRGRFNTSKIVAWNLILVIWLFYFSHPVK